VARRRAHIKAVVDALKGIAPPKDPSIEKKAAAFSGLEPLNIGEDSLFVNVGERTNVTGSKAFARLILAGNYADALPWRAGQVENGAQNHRCQHGRGHVSIRRRR
jgi:5-methyltetrahydrofolate--homocysteine methyltransferase